MFDAIRTARFLAAKAGLPSPEMMELANRAPPEGETLLAIIGVDPAQVNDRAALALTLRWGRAPNIMHDVRYLKLWDRNVEYEKIADDTVRLVRDTPEALATKYKIHILPEQVSCVLDNTGIGRGVTELVRKKMRAERLASRLVPLSITSGQQQTQDERRGEWRCPKRDLVEHLQAVVGTRRIVTNGIAQSDKLLTQMAHFIGEVRKNGYERFEASSDRFGDDLVLALCYCVWWGERTRGAPAIML